jgi:DNA helicase-2/ATP-dependent DNA helicase PcrA
MELETLMAGLNVTQLDAVKHTNGPLLILAGAGTGKTTTITAKIAYMVQELGIDPEHILALTFSREAAANMNNKVEQLLGGTTDVHVSTFHSFCAEIIRENADKCGITAEFSILEDVDSSIILYRDLGIKIKDAALYTSSISKAKDLNITIDKLKAFLQDKKQSLLALQADEDNWEQIFQDNTTRLNTFHLLADNAKKTLKQEKQSWVNFNDQYSEYVKYRDMIRAWVRYETRKKQRGALDYGDLNKKALEFLTTYGSEIYTHRYRYLIIDEFQDTNYVQFELIKILAGDLRNVTVVADPNQTIYAFRGAYTNNIQEFRKYFNIQSGDVVSLDVSFRSTNKILRTSHDLIRRNYSEDDMDLCIQLHNAQEQEGDDVVVAETADENEEARYLVERIEAHLEKGITSSQIAVLYRTHAQGKKIRQALERRGHSIRVKDDVDFLKQPEIKTALAYLYVLDNIGHPKARGTEAWWRLFHHNHALDTSDSIRIGEYLKKQRLSFQEAIYNHFSSLGLSPTGQRTIQQMKQRMDALKEKLILDVSDIVLEVLDASGLSRQFTHDDSKQSKESLLNLRNLYEMAQKFETTHGKDLGEFIAYLEILDEMGKNPPAARIVEDEAINLMTIHSSKGLEFKVVFVINMAKDKFPLFRGGVEPLIPIELMEHFQDLMLQSFSSKNKQIKAIRDRKREIKLEEERRLCYVAMTRAEDVLYLTHAAQYDGRDRDPSEFLNDLGDETDITYVTDNEIRSREMVQDSELERLKAQRKRLIMGSLDSGSFEENLGHLLTYHALKDGNRVNYLDIIEQNWESLDPTTNVKEILDRMEKDEGLPVPSDITFSVSSINTYSNCPKMFELQHVLGMPTRDMEKPDSALNVGSFVHNVLEEAARQKISKKEDLETIVQSLKETEKWKWMDTDLARPLLDVFWERHKNTIQNNLMVEKKFTVPLGDHLFKGFIDRVDLIPGTDNEVEIIDYKTGQEPGKDERAKQLLLYAHGFKHLYPEYTVRRLTLDMLAQQKPRVYELNGDDYVSPRVEPLDNTVLDEMIKTADAILHDHKYGFGRVDNDNQCKKCGYRLYCG